MNINTIGSLIYVIMAIVVAIVYTTKDGFTGTMFGDLRNGSFRGTAMLVGMGIEQYRKHEIECVWPYVMFWVMWIALTGFALFMFYVLENDWLEG